MIRFVIAVNEVNKRSVRLFFEAVLNEGRVELIDELIARDYLGHVSCVERAVIGPAGLRRFVCSRRRRHPGLCVVVEDQLAEDDRVVTRWRATVAPPPVGASSSAAVDAGARGWTVAYSGITIVRLLAGKQVDSHTECIRPLPGARVDGA
ncbi:MAG TPA: nuclear transport factor 2 family protein [Solirubrobacteraceae bacterium]|nr:nuclear transport factor 2 family protein [Solirubrobacteraceae bacterium]